MTIGFRWPIAYYFIDRNNGEYNGYTREDFGFQKLNYTSGILDDYLGQTLSAAVSGQYIYPDSVPPPDNYWIDCCLFLWNIFWMYYTVLA